MPDAAPGNEPDEGPGTSTAAADAARDPEFVAALARGLDVLGAFKRGHARMTLTQVAERTALSRGTARRFLLTLVALGFVATDGKLFWLTPKVLDLGGAYLSASDLVEAAKPALRDCSEALDECCSMAVLDGGDALYVARVEARRIFSSRIEIGTRLPAHCTSLGRVLLAGLGDAELDRWLARHPPVRWNPNTVADPAALRARIVEARRQRHAIVNGELEVGIRSVAVPVLDAAGRTVAAVNVGTSPSRASMERVRRVILPALRDAAERIRAAGTGCNGTGRE